MENFPAENRRLSRTSAITPMQIEQISYDGPAYSREDHDDHESLPVEYFKTIQRWRWVILLFALAGLVLSFLLNIGSLHVYRARTSLDIQSLNADFMNMRSVAPTGDGASSSNEANVQTQIKLLQSDTLLENTIHRLKLEPHSDYIERDDLLSRMKHALHLSRSEPLSFDVLIDATAKSVKVKPLGLTRLVEITCDSWSAEFAAKFCNAFTAEFKDEDLETRSTEAEKTSEWLTRQVADIRLKAEESQRKLGEATGGNGLILSQESTSVGEDRLRQMQGELVKAQADRIEKEAQTRVAGNSPLDSVPNILDSPAYRSYQQKLADLRNQVAEIVPPLTEENPKVIHLRSQIKQVEAELATERTSDTGRLKNEYDAAVHREAMLAAAYHAQEADVSSDLGKASKVNLLRREVESEQQLYQTLLEKAKEAGFASAMQASTIRVVDAARVPKVAVSPKRSTAAVAGVFLGSLIGIGFAFFKDRTTKVFRVPRDVEKFLHVQALGVIPSAEGGPRNAILSSLNASRTIARQSSDVPQGNALTIARWNDNFSIVAEAYRNATFSILLSDSAAKRTRTYVISSPNASEGKTTITSNLGVALSKSKLRVLLVDGDLRKPGLHKALRVSNEVGLRDILRGDIDLTTCAASRYCKATDVPNLSVLPAGTGREEVVELLHSPVMGDLITRLKRDFDMILIDTPPVVHMTDARIFARHADGIILIFRSGVTTREEATSARNLFERDRVRIVGTILNDFDAVKEGQGGYYESYRRYKDQVEAVDKVVGL
jgi:succinoglycan biosynthesis transport protein ExoP